MNLQSKMINFQVEEGGICTISLRLPINSLRLQEKFYDELSSWMEVFKKKENVKGILLKLSPHDPILPFLFYQELFQLSSKNAKQKIKSFHNVIMEWNRWNIPKIALAYGNLGSHCLEWALWCDYIWGPSEEGVVFVFPELKLGLPPFLGGITRLTHKIGLAHTVDFFLASQPVDIEKAHEIGLVDHIQPLGTLEEQARHFLLQLIQKPTKKGKAYSPPPRRSTSWLCRYFARRRLRKIGQIHYKTNPGLQKALESAYKISSSKKLEYGLSLEMKAFLELMDYEIAQNWFHLHFQAEQILHQKMQAPLSRFFSQKPIGVLGAGNMGIYLAYTLAMKDYPVRLKDVNHQALGMGLKQIHSLMQRHYSDWTLNKKFALLSPTTH
ncbi:MAG: hypothetical protein D6785_13065, partial [Planctomycetota bacterium]